MQELSRHQIEGSLGEALGQVVRLELDPVAHPARVGVFGRTLQRGFGDVDGDDLPAALGQPHGVATLPATQIEAVPGFSGSTISANAAFTRPLHTRSRSP